jgi:threonine aldolase
MKIDNLVHDGIPRKHFASDNNSPAHPEVIEAVLSANQGHALAYGDDYFTERANAKLREVFGSCCEPFFLYTGTGANVLSIAALTRSHHAVICAESAHLNGAECGAAEKFAGVKLLTVPTRSGKISVEDIEALLGNSGDQHHVQPGVVSLTQATDFGLCYTVEEIRRICDFAHEKGMYVHMDGARLYTACAALGVNPAEMTRDTGLDVLSLGGTKLGLLGAEAVLFFQPELAVDFKYIRKQGMQLASKVRFLAVQMEALFRNDLWLRLAGQANAMARLLADELRQVPGLELTREVQTNMVYAAMPPQAVEQIRQRYLFYVFDAKRWEVRLVTNYDTTENDVRGFAEMAKQALA